MTIEPVTIGALRRDGRLLWCYCLDCQHEAEIDPGASGLFDDIPVPEAGRHFKCSRCGSRMVTTRPQVYNEPTSVRAARAQDKQRRELESR